MIEVEQTSIWGFEHAIRGMRNPMNSWEKSDSKTEYPNPQYGPDSGVFTVRENDLNLMKELYKAGTEHRKYLRQIMVSMDITAPLYWWKEFDTYKVGTVANSCSTMHKIHSKKFELSDFSIEHLNNDVKFVAEGLFVNNETGLVEEVPYETTLTMKNTLGTVVDMLNNAREKYFKTKDKNWWWQMIQLLPSSYNQRRTVTMNYENVVNIIKQRKGHKLDEWNEFVEILSKLPHIKEIIGEDKEEV